MKINLEFYRRGGFTMIEALVVISIVGLLVALVLPAAQLARESARRTTCINNLRQIGSAIGQFEQTKRRLPSGGEGTTYAQPGVPLTVFELQSTFTQLLPYLEEAALRADMNINFAYNDAAWPANQVAAKTILPSFLCPSNVGRLPDPAGYGATDYLPVVYTDIDAVTGIRNPAARRDGALVLGGAPPAKIIDGLSLTIALAEDAGRNWEGHLPNMKSPYADPVWGGAGGLVWSGSSEVAYAQWCASRGLNSGGLPSGESPTPSGGRAMNRWAEPACAGGISGQANASFANTQPVINGNRLPAGGPPACPWSTANCGPNEEMWSWHPHGANVVMCDGSARFIGERIDARVLRKMVTASEQAPYSDSDVPD
jgi:prepilin-type N-terminal cleavage/methylation domain-containing protein/prepilin-type processing-associated H-X9-DG protein